MTVVERRRAHALALRTGPVESVALVEGVRACATVVDGTVSAEPSHAPRFDAGRILLLEKALAAAAARAGRVAAPRAEPGVAAVRLRAGRPFRAGRFDAADALDAKEAGRAASVAVA